MKTLILKAIKQIVYRFSEKTPPEVKYSLRNKVIGDICYSIGTLIVMIKNKY